MNGDPISLFLDYSLDASCIFDFHNNSLIKCNRGFEILTGYSHRELADSSFTLDKLFYRKNFQSIRHRLSHMGEENHLRDETRIFTRQRNLRDVEVIIYKIHWQKREYFLCSLRDIEARKELERDLRDKIAAEQKRVMETAREILRIERLLAKLHFLPTFLTELENCNSLAELVEKAVRLMCHPSGFAYAYVAIFLIEGEFLKLAYSNRELPLQQFHLHKQHKLAKVARREKIISEGKGEYIFPLVSAQKTEGVLQVFLEETERLLTAENKQVEQACLDFLKVVSDYIALSITHFRIVQEREQIRWQDPQTGCYSSAYFFKQLGEYIQAKRPLGLILIDIEEFYLNSLLGNGNSLKQIVQIMRDCLPEDAIVNRVCDDKFGIILEREYLPQVISLVEKLKRKLCRTFSKISDTECTFHAGLVIYEGEPEELSNIWAHACRSIKESKVQGGNKIYYWQRGALESKMANKLM